MARKRFDPKKHYELDPSASPINPLPPVIVILALAMLGIEAVLQLGERGLAGGPAAIGWRLGLLQKFGFWDAVFERAMTVRWFGADAVWRFFSYPFVNTSAAAMLFGIVILTATGNVVARTFSPFAIIAAFLACSAVGAVVFGLWETENRMLSGPFVPAYGFIGLLSWALWQEALKTGGSVWRAFSLVIFLTILQTIRWFVIGRDTSIISELAGFATAFALAFVLAPDGRQRMRHWLSRIRGGE